MGFEAGQGGVGAHGAAGVSGRWDGHRLDAQLEGPGNGRGQAPGLERARRVEAFVLDVKAVVHHFSFETGRTEERGESFAQAELESVVADGEELAVAPHRRLPAGQGFAHEAGPRGVEVVADEERLAALGAEVPELFRVEPLAA